MISGKLFKHLSCVLCLLSLTVSCRENEELIKEGYRLVYICRPAEELISYNNDSCYYDGNLRNTDLHLFVTSSLKENPFYRDLKRYTIDGDPSIEDQISNLIDPEKKYTGITPKIIEYRTEPCSAIRISMYDANNNFISDITEQAHFVSTLYYPENYNNTMLISSSKQLIGTIKDGMTISEYLENKPMIFAEAFFVFDNLDRDLLLEGYYLKTEIELTNGTVLVSYPVDGYPVPGFP